MDLTLDEQRLLAEFKKLNPAGKEELLAYAASLARKTGVENNSNQSSATQCKIKKSEEHPEAEKSPFFTE
ncbi:MAG TPA: hypothetical protein VGJ93_07535 [Desulfuromonadaceae bacterium]|jgi:hypothetical protein